MTGSYVLDDTSLLRMLNSIEGKTPQIAEGNAFYELINTHPTFDLLRENEHLRTVLRTFLEKNIALAKAHLKVSHIRSQGWVDRVRLTGERRRLEEQIKSLQAEVEAAFKPYEMLRRLTAPDDIMLKRYIA